MVNRLTHKAYVINMNGSFYKAKRPNNGKKNGPQQIALTLKVIVYRHCSIIHNKKSKENYFSYFCQFY